MTRILLIGNSHAAAFRKGWDLVRSDFEDVDMDFFVLGGHEYYNLGVDPKRRVFGALDADLFDNAVRKKLHAFNASEQIDLDGYDQVLVVGNQHGVIDVLRLLASRDIAGLAQTGERQMLSSGAFQAVLEDIASAFAPAPEWAELVDIPVTLHAMPRPSMTVLDDTEDSNKMRRSLKRLRADPRGIAAALGQLGELYRRVLPGDTVRFVEQPADTLSDIGLTKAEYNRDAVGYSGADMPVDDYKHMNPHYGAKCLSAALGMMLSGAEPKKINV